MAGPNAESPFLRALREATENRQGGNPDPYAELTDLMRRSAFQAQPADPVANVVSQGIDYFRQPAPVPQMPQRRTVGLAPYDALHPGDINPNDRIGRAIIDHYADYFDPWTYDAQGRRVIDTPEALIPNKAGKLPETEKPWWWPIVGGVDIASNFIAPEASAAGKVAMAAASIGGRGGRIGRLAMDEASRMARARQLGFHTDLMLAHGTNGEFGAFDPAKLGSMTGAPTARLGVWTEVRSPESPLADFHAKEATERNGGNPAVIPLLHRAETRGRIALKGDESEPQMAATVADAWDRGYDAIIMDNFTVAKGRKGSILVVKDPAQLRVPWAKFDPAKRDQSDLLAGLAGAGLVGSTLSSENPPPEDSAD